MPKSKSYKSRNGSECVVLDAVDGQSCWGLVRFTSHKVYLCEGHNKPPNYANEPVPPSPEEMARLLADAQAAKDAKKAEAEAARWFRPILVEMRDLEYAPHPFWSSLSAVTLSFLHSALGETQVRKQPPEGDEEVDEAEALRFLAWQATAELRQRDLPWPEPIYELVLAGEADAPIGTPEYANPFGPRALALPFEHLTDSQVLTLWGVAAMVADFSCLERGVRQAAEHLFKTATDALHLRTVETKFLDTVL